MCTRVRIAETAKKAALAAGACDRRFRGGRRGSCAFEPFRHADRRDAAALGSAGSGRLPVLWQGPSSRRGAAKDGDRALLRRHRFDATGRRDRSGGSQSLVARYFKRMKRIVESHEGTVEKVIV
jgi:hypothetical protein